jgi:1-acyl-sn-glycerol-3-phosphate acyltransferase
MQRILVSIFLSQIAGVMKAFQTAFGIIQIILIVLWTGICGLIGIVLMLITWNGQWVHYFEGRYLFCPLVLFIARVKLKVTGLENLDTTKSCIYVSNHVSHLDVVAIARAIPLGLFYIGKKELKKVPILGQYMYLIGHIFIDRKNREKAMQSMRKAALLINKGKNVITFPEGTRTRDGKTAIFKRGTFIIAKEGSIDIQPLAVVNADTILSRDSYMIKPGTIEVRIGKRIMASEIHDLNAEASADYVRKRVIALLESH